MAITANGKVATGNEKLSDTNLAMQFSSTTAVGDFLIMGVAVDNSGLSAPTLDSFTDTQGNTWTVQSQGTASPTSGAGSGIRVMLATCPVTTAHAVGDFVTATFSASVTAKAGVVIGLSGANTGTPNNIATASGTNGASTTAISQNPSASGKCIVLVSGFENNAAPTGDSDTTNGSWSSVAEDHTTGGGATANIAVGVQTKIVTASGAVNCSMTGAADWIAIACNINEAAAATPRTQFAAPPLVIPPHVHRASYW